MNFFIFIEFYYHKLKSLFLNGGTNAWHSTSLTLIKSYDNYIMMERIRQKCYRV